MAAPRPHAASTSKADLIWKIAARAQGALARTLHAAQLRGQGAPPDRPRARRAARCRSSPCCARRRPAADRPTRAAAPARTARTRGLVRRPRAGDRRRPRGDRVRARLARDDRLPGALAPRRSPARARARRRRAVEAARTRPSTSRPAPPTGSPPRAPPSSCAQVGVAKVRGFMLNATHYDWTGANIQHGLEISRLTGGKHFIINTAENGRGPVHYKEWIDRSRHLWRRITVWCNPGLRGLGPAPTTATSHPDKVDAYLWINRPGYAQSCQHRPIAWYLPRALTLARYATDWEKAAARHPLRPPQALPAEGLQHPVVSARRRRPRQQRLELRPGAREASSWRWADAGSSCARPPATGRRCCSCTAIPSSSYDWRHLLELRPAAAAALPSTSSASGCPRSRATTSTPLLGQADLAEERSGAGLGDRARSFIVAHDMGTSVATELLARDVEGGSPFRLAGVLLLQRQHGARAGQPDARAEAAAQPLRPARRPAQQRARLPAPVRLGSSRPPTH